MSEKTLEDFGGNYPPPHIMADRIAELEAKVEAADLRRAESETTLWARIAELEAQQQWIAVEDRLPPPFTPVLVAQDTGAVFIAQMESPEYWESKNGLLIETPMAWHSLPAPPEPKE